MPAVIDHAVCHVPQVCCAPSRISGSPPTPTERSQKAGKGAPCKVAGRPRHPTSRHVCTHVDHHIYTLTCTALHDADVAWVAAMQFNAEIDALDPAESPADAASAAEAVQHLNIFGATERWFSQQCGAGAGFRPLVTPGFSACRDVLPHWNKFGQDGEPVRTVTQVGGAQATSHR